MAVIYFLMLVILAYYWLSTQYSKRRVRALRQDVVVVLEGMQNEIDSLKVEIAGKAPRS